MIKAEIWSDSRATLYGPFPFPFIKLINGLSGRKLWDSVHAVKVEATPANLRLLRECDYPIEFIDKTGQMTEQQIIESMPTQHDAPEPLEIDYQPGVPWYDHQDRAVRLSWFREWYALLFDVGLGKTAIIIATAGILYLTGRITGVFVLCPKGPHRQWLEEEFPKHIDKRIEWNGILWQQKPIREFKKKGLTVFVMNTDGIRTNKGFAAAKSFILAHKDKVLLAVDESGEFANQASDRTRSLMLLKDLSASYRRIADGTPICKNIISAWSQFNFLDPRILGHKYLTSFRARFCVMSNHDRDKVVGQKNTEEFYSLIAPHSFRMTQEEAIDLPPKIYITREYDMSDETAHHYQEIKETLLTTMADGSTIDAKNPAVAMLRLHQIVCGHLPDLNDVTGEKTLHRIGKGERVKEMMNIIRQVEGPVVVWARFIEDRNVIVEALEKAGESYAVYHGTDDVRAQAKEDFLSGKSRVFVSNQRSGGVGLNLQGKCGTVIYYSNSFNARDRWQSEGRTYRIGTLGTVTYFDLVARKSVDRNILRNLQAKKDLAELTLDTIRRAIMSANDSAA
jgi:SNF2 family DNA or RNA helicase